MNASNSGPLRQSMGFSIKANVKIPPEIIILFFSGGPPTIGGSVVAVIVDAIKHFAGWGMPHVSEEVFKFMPAPTNLYTSLSVMAERRIPGVFATLKHCRPRMMYRGTRQAMCLLRSASKTATGYYTSGTHMAHSMTA